MKKSKLTPLAKLMIVVVIIGGLVFGLYKSGILKFPQTTKNVSVDETSIVEGTYDLIISGSPTIGDKIVPELLKGLFNKEVVKYEFSKIDDEHQIITVNFVDKDAKILIKTTGTGTGFKDLEKNQNIIVMSTRKINESEITKLGDLTSSKTENIIACDGVAVIVNSNASLSVIEKSDVIKIYNGEITDWDQLNIGKKGKINLYALAQLSIGTTKLTESVIKVLTNQEAVQKVMADTDGLGLISMLYVSSDTKTIPVSDGTSKKFFPNKLTVGTQDYPLTRELYFYTSASNNNDLAKKIVKFALSKDGQKIIGETGFVEFNTTEMEDKPYSVLPANAKRISINFRFNTGSMELDNKSLIDVGRLAEKSEMTNSSIYLIGFADSQGSISANLDLSIKRAETVKNELETVGISVTKVIGLGKEFPIADNGTDEGRQKNRRVEIWLVK